MQLLAKGTVKHIPALPLLSAQACVVVTSLRYLICLVACSTSSCANLLLEEYSFAHVGVCAHTEQR